MGKVIEKNYIAVGLVNSEVTQQIYEDNVMLAEVPDWCSEETKTQIITRTLKKVVSVICHDWPKPEAIKIIRQGIFTHSLKTMNKKYVPVAYDAMLMYDLTKPALHMAKEIYAERDKINPTKESE